jgi:TolB-like protein/DNA-binding winged helix-turn-helix (wHTH) protein/Tfp pilus assembly protein PilF
MPIKGDQIRFGVFEVRLNARELRKYGVRIKLEDQPFEILTALIEKPGEIVTRRELQARIWPDGTFVDFEKSLTKAVNKIRAALNDSAANPRFVETISRRGYRFIAPVAIAENALPLLNAGAQTSQVASEPGIIQRSRLPRKLVLSAAGVFIFVLALAVWLDPGGVHARLLASKHIQRFQSLAVLPLENVSHDPEQEYFADGLTDALITDLAKINGVRVISRTSVMQYKRTRKPLSQIARELDVDAAVEGTVLRSGGRVRTTVQLLQARTDRHLWAETYERNFQDVIPLERQMALEIAKEISAQLRLADRSFLSADRTSNPAAFDAYLRGRHFWDMREAQAIPEAVGYFEQALREDPKFALAWSGLADCYATGWWKQVDFSRAEKYARIALALAPQLAEAHISLAYADYGLSKFADAEREARRAITSNPNYAAAHHFLAMYMLLAGRPTEALAENERAHQLDPFSYPITVMRGVIFLSMHAYDRAAEQFMTAADLMPLSASPHGALAMTYWLDGKAPEALAEEHKSQVLASSPERLRIQQEVSAVYAQAGFGAASRRWAQLKENAFHGDEEEAYDIAGQYAMCGNKEKALEWLNRAAAMKSGGWLSLRSPAYDTLHDDPRFQDLMRRVGLAP